MAKKKRGPYRTDPAKREKKRQHAYNILRIKQEKQEARRLENEKRAKMGLPPMEIPKKVVVEKPEIVDENGFPSIKDLKENKNARDSVIITGPPDVILNDDHEKSIYQNAVRELAQQVFDIRGSVSYAEKMVILIIAFAQVQLYRKKLLEKTEKVIVEHKESKIIYDGLVKLGLLNEQKVGVKPELEATKLLLNNMKFEDQLKNDGMYERWKNEQNKIIMPFENSELSVENKEE